MKSSLYRPPILACGLALFAVCAVLLPASGAQAASKRGAVLVKDIYPGPKRASSIPSGLTDVRGTLFFAAGDRRHGTELWRSDGTRRGTRMVKDIRPGPRPCATSKRACRGQGASSYPSELTDAGRTLFFVINDGAHGNELWRSDGTARGTRMVVGTGQHSISSLTDVAGALFFIVGGNELWRTAGHAASTGMIKGVSAPNNLTAVGSILYFSDTSGLWRSDTSGTVLVKPFGQGPNSLTNVAGTLFFIAAHGTQDALWRSDGTESGTTLVKDVLPAGSLTAVGRTLFFVASDGLNNTLWRSDGTEAGTIPITSVGPTPEGDSLYPSLTAVGGTLYFVRNGGGYFSSTLMRTDGTLSGTRELGSGMIPRHLTAVGNTLYFEGYDPKNGNELWRSDGTPTGTRLVRDIRRGERSSRPGDIGGITAVGKTLFFSANDGVHATELWRAGPYRARRPRVSARRGRTPRSCFGRKAAVSLAGLPQPGGGLRRMTLWLTKSPTPPPGKPTTLMATDTSAGPPVNLANGVNAIDQGWAAPLQETSMRLGPVLANVVRWDSSPEIWPESPLGHVNVPVAVATPVFGSKRPKRSTLISTPGVETEKCSSPPLPPLMSATTMW